MPTFRLLIKAFVIFSTIFMLLILGVQWYAPRLAHHVLAYTKEGGIALMDADRRLSRWFSHDKIGWVVPPQELQWSPNGQALLFDVYLDVIGTEIHSLSLEDLSVSSLKDIENASGAWSPDNHLLAVSTAESGLSVIDADSGNTLDYLTQAGSSEPVWSPDGNMLAFASGTEMRVMDVKTGKIISDLTQPIYKGYPRFSRWSPDGKWLVFASFHEQDIFHITLSAIDLNNHKVRQLFSPIDFSTSRPIWSPDSQYIAFSTIQLITPSKSTEVVHILNLFTGEDTFFAPQGTNGSYFVQAWSSDGEWVLFLDVENHIVYGINRNDNQPQILVPASYQPTFSIQLSPDGQQAVFTGAISSISHTGSLFVLDMKTHVISQLADNITSAVWQP